MPATNPPSIESNVLVPAISLNAMADERETKDGKRPDPKPPIT